jgi:hypothetical protein
MSRRRGLAALLAGGLARRDDTASWLAGQVALAAGLGLVASAFVTVVLSTGQLHVPYWQLWLVITGLFLLQWTLMPPGEATPAANPDPVEGSELQDRPYPQVDRWERRLSVTSGDPEWYTRVVRDRLAALVAERLRQRHGVAMTTDPGQARVILGEELYEFLTAPLTRTPDRAGLSRLITRIEEV